MICYMFCVYVKFWPLLYQSCWHEKKWFVFLFTRIFYDVQILNAKRKNEKILSPHLKAINHRQASCLLFKTLHPYKKFSVMQVVMKFLIHTNITSQHRGVRTSNHSSLNSWKCTDLPGLALPPLFFNSTLLWISENVRRQRG